MSPTEIGDYDGWTVGEVIAAAVLTHEDKVAILEARMLRVATVRLSPVHTARRSAGTVTRAALAQRLAELVNDDQVLVHAIAFLEERRAVPGGSGSRMIWHIDRSGRVRAVEINAGIYQAS